MGVGLNRDGGSGVFETVAFAPISAALYQHARPRKLPLGPKVLIFQLINQNAKHEIEVEPRK